MSKSDRLIVYTPSLENPLIGHNAPSLGDVSTGRKWKPSSTKVVTRKPPSQGSSVQQALLPITTPSAHITDPLVVNVPDPSSGN